jgi:hypothetical protein
MKNSQLDSTIEPNVGLIRDGEKIAQEDIASLAYQLWERRRGNEDCSPEDDWLEAERLLREQSVQNV